MVEMRLSDREIFNLSRRVGLATGVMWLLIGEWKRKKPRLLFDSQRLIGIREATNKHAPKQPECLP